MEPTEVAALRRRYAEYESRQLVAVALTGAANLTPVACDVLKAELATRKLVPELWPTLDVRAERFTPEELDALVLRLQFLPCPHCGAQGTSLNGFVSAPPTPLELIGLSIVPTFRIGCQRCLGKRGAWRLFKLKTGRRWRPSEAFRDWAFSHSALLTRFASNDAAIAALLRLDYAGFLRAIGCREDDITAFAGTSGAGAR